MSRQEVMKQLGQENKQLKDENARLQQQIADMELQAINGRAYVRGMQPEIEQLLKERERYKRQVEQTGSEAVRDLERAKARFKEFLNDIPIDLPYGYRSILDALSNAEIQEINHSNVLCTAIENSIQNHPSAALGGELVSIISISRLAGMYDGCNNLLVRIRAKSDPDLACLYIMEELRATGRPGWAVNMLNRDWIKEHISGGRGLSHGKLSEALTHAWRYRREYAEKGKTAVSYGADEYVAEENLRKFTRYLDKVDKVAYSNTPDIKESLAREYGRSKTD